MYERSHPSLSLHSGIDPDSTKNVHIHDSTIDTGDDCIAIKSGKDWSGRQVNISTENILVEVRVALHHTHSKDVTNYNYYSE